MASERANKRNVTAFVIGEVFFVVWLLLGRRTPSGTRTDRSMGSHVANGLCSLMHAQSAINNNMVDLCGEFVR